jgi:hypothetical protein
MDAVSEVSKRAQRRGRSPNVAFNQLIFALIQVAEAGGIKITCAYSQGSGEWSGEFFELVNEVYRLCHGKTLAGSAIGARTARVIAAWKKSKMKANRADF